MSDNNINAKNDDTLDEEIENDDSLDEKIENDDTLDEEVENDDSLDREIEIFDYSDSTVESIDFREDIKKLDEEEDYDNISKTKRFFLEVWSYIKILVLAAVLAFFIDTFILINANVPTGSMESTIMTGSRIMGSRLSYIFSDPERGDIAVFKYPLDEKQNFVKRVIGLPGETVKITNGEIFIYKDGKCIEGPLEEPYLNEEWVRNNDGYVFNVPEDCYLMLGDNRNWSADARKWYDDMIMQGKDTDIIYVHKDKIIGKVYFVYWYEGINLDWIDGQDVNY